MEYLKPYIIGETAYNHEGNIEYLYRMTDDISGVGLEAVKYHLLLDPKTYMQKGHPLMKEVKKWIFSEDQWKGIMKYASGKNLDIVALCDDVESVHFVNRCFGNIFALELHATSLNDYFLLEAATAFNGKIILGIGGSTLDEISYALEFLKEKGKDDILLMYGFQSFPTDYRQINLSKMSKIKSLFGLPVGYADHTAFDDPNNEVISCMAAMMGINILEKHYTPEEGKERVDYQAAIGKDRMKRIKQLMQIALTVFGSGGLNMSEAELEYGNTGPMKKAVVAKKNIKKGELLSLNNLWFKRTGQGSPIRQDMFPRLLGLEAARDIAEDEIIDYSNIKYSFRSSKVKPSEYTKIKKEGNQS